MPVKSRLNRADLSVAYHALKTLRDVLIYDEEDGGASAPPFTSAGGGMNLLGTALCWISTKLDALQPSDRYLAVDRGLLKETLHVEESGLSLLERKSDQPRVEASSAIRQGHMWSSKNLHRHLTLLEQSLPQAETCARSWIEAFFLRASAMVGDGEHMILNIEPTIETYGSPTATTILAGQISYSAFVATDRIAPTIFEGAEMTLVCEMIKNQQAAAARGLKLPELTPPKGFFAVEAKLTDERPKFIDHLPQAVAELYACATLLHQKFLRGALTNGHRWIFIIVRVNDDASGGQFKRSGIMNLEIMSNGPRGREVRKDSVDRIAAILSYWIEHSFEDIGEDDWYEPFDWED